MTTGAPRSYVVRTYGCQMNEHDSERIAGLLEADGLVPRRVGGRRRRRRAQHLLHPRERRQQAVRQPRPPQAWKDATRRPPDRRVGLPRPEGPRRRRQRRRRDVDVVMGTHNVHRAAELLREAAGRSRPLTEILEAAVIDDHAMFPSALPARRETSLQRVGDDPDRLRQQLRVLHRARRARRRDQPPVRRVVAEVAAARRRGRHRGDAARPERQQLRPRPPARRPPGRRRRRPACARCSPTCSRDVGAVDGIRRVRYTSPHPKDMRPETFAAMAETPAVCEHLHYPLQSGSDRVLAADAPRLHRRALPRPARRGPRASCPTSPCRPTSSSASPARPTTTSSARSRSPPRPSTTTPTRSSSRPAPGTEAAEHDRSTSSIRPSPASGSERLRVVVERSALAQARGAGRPDRGGARRGPERRRTPTVVTGRTRQNKLVHFTPPHAAAHRQLRHGRDHRRRAAPPRRPVRRARRRAGATSIRIPVAAL